ncbi:hypothetical protein IIU_06714 [Bacillus cereus VD133]|uniref:Uncharacterized protein n=1 Tax=Bacillus cereus VD133 TaxID=1053233 RepID=A0A9W5PJT8_BACCE|nr:HBL/NHE enterotoxin family protein [Bacillus cereus]EOO24492.1 hypothetical protein IIU_06714 [Bacillus cereus VD133]
MFRIKRNSVFFCIAICIIYQPFRPYYVKAEVEADSMINKLDKATSVILEQHNTFLSHLGGLDVIDTQIKAALIIREKNTQKNAREWKETIKPASNKIVTSIRTYDRQFQSEYKDISGNHSQKNSQKTIVLLTTLQNEVNQLQNTIYEHLNGLIEYRDHLSNNIKEFKSNYNPVLAQINGEYKIIQTIKHRLNSLVTKYNKDQKTRKDLIRQGQSSVAIYIAKQMEITLIKINEAKQTITQFQTEVSVLNILNQQSSIFIQNLDESINAIQKYLTSWEVLDSKMKNLIASIDDSKEIDDIFFQAEMHAIKESWDNIQFWCKNSGI